MVPHDRGTLKVSETPGDIATAVSPGDFLFTSRTFSGGQTFRQPCRKVSPAGGIGDRGFSCKRILTSKRYACVKHTPFGRVFHRRPWRRGLVRQRMICRLTARRMVTHSDTPTSGRPARPPQTGHHHVCQNLRDLCGLPAQTFVS